MEVRSYRRVFDLERRIYRVDRVRLNPAGVPVRGVVYFLTILLAGLLCAHLPLLASVVRVMPWYLCDLALPGLSAALLTVIRLEGRPFHLAAVALVRLRAGTGGNASLRGGRSRSGPQAGRRWLPHRILMLPDGSDARMRRLRYTGPGALLVTAAHERHASSGVLAFLRLRPHVTVHEKPGASRPTRGEVIALRRSARLSVR